jgi:hypothetical protein
VGGGGEGGRGRVLMPPRAEKEKHFSTLETQTGRKRRNDKNGAHNFNRLKSVVFVVKNGLVFQDFDHGHGYSWFF